MKRAWSFASQSRDFNLNNPSAARRAGRLDRGGPAASARHADPDRRPRLAGRHLCQAGAHAEHMGIGHRRRAPLPRRRRAARAAARAEGGAGAVALHSSAADALTQMSVRVRQRRRAIGRGWCASARISSSSAMARTNACWLPSARQIPERRTQLHAVAGLDAKLDAIDQRLAAQFW